MQCPIGQWQCLLDGLQLTWSSAYYLEATNLYIEPNLEDLCSALGSSTGSHVSPIEEVLELLVTDVTDVIKIEEWISFRLVFHYANPIC